MTAKIQKNADLGEKTAAMAKAEKVDGPVLTVILKRLRAVKKKLGRISDLEACLRATPGKEINADQQELLRSKPGVVAVVDELEKVAALLKDAVKEETDIAKKLGRDEGLSEAMANASLSATPVHAEEQADEHDVQEPYVEPEQGGGTASAEDPAGVRDAVMRLLQLVYFSQLFDAQGSWRNQMERQACITYNYSIRSQVEPPSEQDLLHLAEFGKLVTARPASKVVSHKDALEDCYDLALRWLGEGDYLVPDLNLSVAYLREQLDQVLSSEYYTTQPHKTTTPLNMEQGEHGAVEDDLGAAGPEDKGMSEHTQEPIIEEKVGADGQHGFLNAPGITSLSTHPNQYPGISMGMDAPPPVQLGPPPPAARLGISHTALEESLFSSVSQGGLVAQAPVLEPTQNGMGGPMTLPFMMGTLTSRDHLTAAPTTVGLAPSTTSSAVPPAMSQAFPFFQHRGGFVPGGPPFPPRPFPGAPIAPAVPNSASPPVMSKEVGAAPQAPPPSHYPVADIVPLTGGFLSDMPHHLGSSMTSVPPSAPEVPSAPLLPAQGGAPVPGPQHPTSVPDLPGHLVSPTEGMAVTGPGRGPTNQGPPGSVAGGRSRGSYDRGGRGHERGRGRDSQGYRGPSPQGSDSRGSGYGEGGKSGGRYGGQHHVRGGGSGRNPRGGPSYPPPAVST